MEEGRAMEEGSRDCTEKDREAIENKKARER